MAHRPCSVRRAINRVAAFYSPETAGSGSRLAQGQRWVSGCWAWCHNPGGRGIHDHLPRHEGTHGWPLHSGGPGCLPLDLVDTNTEPGGTGMLAKARNGDLEDALRMAGNVPTLKQEIMREESKTGNLAPALSYAGTIRSNEQAQALLGIVQGLVDAEFSEPE